MSACEGVLATDSPTLASLSAGQGKGEAVGFDQLGRARARRPCHTERSRRVRVTWASRLCSVAPAIARVPVTWTFSPCLARIRLQSAPSRQQLNLKICGFTSHWLRRDNRQCRRSVTIAFPDSSTAPATWLRSAHPRDCESLALRSRFLRSGTWVCGPCRAAHWLPGTCR